MVDDDPALGQASYGGVCIGVVREDDRGTASRILRHVGPEACSRETVDQVGGQHPVPIANPVDSGLFDDLQAAGGGKGSAHGGGAELEPACVCVRPGGSGVEGELVLDAEPAERRGLQIEVRSNVEEGEAGAAAQPLEGSRQKEIHPPRSYVHRDLAGRLIGIQQKESAVPVGYARQLLHLLDGAGGEKDVRRR